MDHCPIFSMTASTILFAVAIAVFVVAIDGASSSAGELSLTAHDQDVLAQNMLSFLGSPRPALKAPRLVNVTAPSVKKENYLTRRVIEEIRHLNSTLPHAENARLTKEQARQMRIIYRHMKQLAKSTSNKRQSRILIEALSIFAGAKIGSMMATECRNWLDKLSNLAVSINYGKPQLQQPSYYQPYYTQPYVQQTTVYYGAPCNDNTFPTCSATSGTPCNNNGLPACYFDWPLCNSNVYPVCSTTSGTPCNNNGLPYCVDAGVPCNSNNLGYCVNGPAPCNDNNWPYCPGFIGPTLVG